MSSNYIILEMLIVGVVMLVIAARMTSSFEDGSFLLQMFLGLGGAALLVGGLLWKLVSSLL